MSVRVVRPKPVVQPPAKVVIEIDEDSARWLSALLWSCTNNKHPGLLELSWDLRGAGIAFGLILPDRNENKTTVDFGLYELEAHNNA